VLVTVVWVEELGEVSFGQRHETFGDLMCGILLEDEFLKQRAPAPFGMERRVRVVVGSRCRQWPFRHR